MRSKGMVRALTAIRALWPTDPEGRAAFLIGAGVTLVLIGLIALVRGGL